MNGKKIILAFAIGLVIGALGAGFIIWHVYTGRSAGEVAALNKRNAELAREYTERQRVIENNVDQCLRYVETARGITERTGENASRAVANLREASDLIRAGIVERQALNVELDRLRAGLYRIGDLGRVGVE